MSSKRGHIFKRKKQLGMSKGGWAAVSTVALCGLHRKMRAKGRTDDLTGDLDLGAVPKYRHLCDFFLFVLFFF